MNKILSDKLWDLWFKLPHCKLIQNNHRELILKNFDYINCSDISIFAPNCIAGELYSILGLPFLSPCINCFMNRNDFVLFSNNLKDYMSIELQIVQKHTDYYITSLKSNKLKEIFIYFPHDDDPIKIVNDWERRKQRINYDKTVFICDDTRLDLSSYQIFDEIIAFRKILFTAKDRSLEYPWCYQLKYYRTHTYVGAYSEKMLRGIWRFEMMWNYVDFLNYGIINN